MNAALSHAFGVGVGWLTLAYFARTLANKHDDYQVRKEQDKDLKSYIQARYPVIAAPSRPIAPKVKPTEPELLPETVDINDPDALDTSEYLKTASLRPIVDRMINPIPVNPHKPFTPSDISGSLTNAAESFTSKDIHPLHLVLTAAAVLGGTAGGYALANSMHRKRSKKKLDNEIADTRNKIDQLFLEEYARTRGIPKTATEKSESDHGILGRVLSGTGRSYLLYAAGMFALSYAVSKRSADDADPRRQERKAIENYARNRAILNQAPTLVAPNYLGSIGESTGSRSRPASRNLQLV
jgi:hypothetical protein